jgi:hypothetical protein
MLRGLDPKRFWAVFRRWVSGMVAADCKTQFG